MGDLRIGTTYPLSIILGTVGASKIMCGDEQIWPESVYKECTVIISGFNYRTAEGDIYARITLDTKGTHNIEYIKGDGYLDVIRYGANAYLIRISNMPYENMDVYEIRESSEGLISKDPWAMEFVCDLTKGNDESNIATIDFGNLGRPTHQMAFMLQAIGRDGSTVRQSFSVKGILYNNGEIRITNLVGPEDMFTWTVRGQQIFLHMNYEFDGEYKYTSRDIYDNKSIIINVGESNKDVLINLAWITEDTYDASTESVIWGYTYKDDKCYVNYDENLYTESGYKWGAHFRLTVHSDGRVEGRIDDAHPNVFINSDYITLSFGRIDGYSVDSYGGTAVSGITMPDPRTIIVDRSLITGQTFNAQITAHQIL